MSRDRYDVVVIGGGTAGLVTASGCARLGRRVALVEREALGGDCLWTGCVPTKALVASARLAHSMRHADRFGLSPVEPPIDPGKIMESMRETQRITEKHDHPDKFRRLGIDVIFGDARFTGPREVEVGTRRLSARDIVLATGSRTRVPPIEGLQDAGWLDHVSLLRQDSFPRSVVILGAGPIATEFAQLFRRFGSAVTIVGRGGHLLAREDVSIRRAVTRKLRDEGIEIRLLTTATAVRVEAARKIVTLEDADGSTSRIEADALFLATGRRGNVEGMDLETAEVRVEHDFIVADPFLRTTAPHIWACGDIHGKLLFTHVAAYEAVKLVRNLLFPGLSACDYSNIPWAVFTDPEVGRVGMTEEEAIRAVGEDRIRIWTVDMADLDRAVTDRADEGFLKIITTTGGKILGAHAFCAGASTLIELIVLARQQNAKMKDLARLVSPYPSFADALGKATALYYQDLGAGRLGRIARRLAALTHR